MTRISRVENKHVNQGHEERHCLAEEGRSVGRCAQMQLQFIEELTPSVVGLIHCLAIKGSQLDAFTSVSV
jgi:hypothetical protein